MVRYELNNQYNGVEIYFDNVPDECIRNEVKSYGFRWHRNKKCWYAKQNDETMALAKRLCGDGDDVTTGINSVNIVVEPVINKRCCYSASVRDFLDENETDFINQMISAFSSEYLLSLGEEQIHAWKDCFRVLQKRLAAFEEESPGFSIIFEYALPYESGRRPDVILLSKEYVLILEFKMKGLIQEADVDQVRAYARDIKEYHYESRDRKVIPFLVLTKGSGIRTDLSGKYGDVRVCSEEWLYEVLGDSIEDIVTTCDTDQWMASKYEPLPTIVESARNFMDHAELPNIRRVNSTCIPETLENLMKLTQYAKENKMHTIAFVTGVPGAGKTYLGLQYVYDIREQDDKVNSVYLSGNGPLVRVLTDALKSNVFVKDLHKVENEFLRNGSPDFSSNVIVFDEGQRAWDIDQMKAKNRGNFSEPDVMINLAERCLDWCVLLILVGEGQEIYKGENSGIEQWNTAINKGSKNWKTVYPSKLKGIFSEQDTISGIDYEVFDLTVSLRSHLAGDVSDFINLIIDGKFDDASKLIQSIYNDGYSMYYTRDLNKAKAYCIDRYYGAKNKRYGMLSSSNRYTGLSKYGIGSQFKPSVENWFNDDPSSSGSCCALKVAISEFDCQGLEIDMPIIGWGQDLKWTGSKWKPNELEGSDAYDYRINSYRVLLTRGRDGLILFIPPEMNIEAEVFRKIGIHEL